MTRVPQAAAAAAPGRVPLVRGVCVALDRRATCHVERMPGGIRIESQDAPARAEADELEALDAPVVLRPLARLLGVAGLTRGVRVSGHARVPAAAGLGTHVALVLAASAALLRLCARPVDPDVLMRWVDEALREDGVPDAVDLSVALRGGVAAAGATGPVRVAADPAWVEQCLLLADVGVPARPDPRAGELGVEAAALAGETAAALARRDEDAVAAMIARGWLLACRADARLTTPEADAVLAEAREAGGAGRPCGGGGGGLVALWVPIERRAALEARLRGRGVRSFPARVDLLGLESEPA